MAFLDLSTPLSPVGSTMGYPSKADSDVPLEDGSKGSAAGESVSDLPVMATAYERRLFGAQLKDLTRICIFNVGTTTVDEAWTELSAMLPPSEIGQIVKLIRVTNRSTHPRIDMYVRTELAASLRRDLAGMTKGRTPRFVRSLERSGRLGDYRSTAISGWRFTIWQSWHDRNDRNLHQRRPKDFEMANHPWLRLLSLNINGFPSKKEQLEQLLDIERITVVALQETLVSASQYPVLVSGFRTFAQEWQEGFRGQAILVRKHLPAYAVPHGTVQLEGYKYLLHVKVLCIPGLPSGKALHFVSAYFPSGGNMRAKRSAGFAALKDLYHRILGKDAEAVIVVMGDLNVDIPQVEKKLLGLESSLALHPVRGSSRTRFPVKGNPTALDHMLASPAARGFFVRPRVLRQWALSDHRPLYSILRHVPSAEGGLPRAPKVRFDRGELARSSFELCNDNRWLPIQDLEAESAEDLSALADGFTTVLRDVGNATHIRSEDSGSSPSKKPYLPRRLKKLLTDYRTESSDLTFSATLQWRGKRGVNKADDYRHAKRKFKSALRAFRRREQAKHYARIAEDFVAHDHKNVWSRLRSQVTTSTDTVNSTSDSPHPVRNKAGVLCVDEANHVAAVKEHYQALAQDDPDGTSRSSAHWDSIPLSYPRTEDTLSDLNAALQWKEIVVAIRSANRDTAPGLDGTHINLLKALVSEESMAKKFGLDKEARPDGVRIALPIRSMPNEPLTPMGKALWKVLNKIWELEAVPDSWNDVAIVNLFKKGDPELLVNYRGLSLIPVGLKIVMIVMVHRLEKVIDAKKLLISQSQSGFRKREEAIAQFLVMAESVRRRHIAGLPTIGIFIDLIKAYDRVPHEALYRVLDHRGVRGKFLNFVKGMYRGSSMKVRTCGKLAESFNMWRGLRQGCPLSPLLFILFIDHMLVETRPSEAGLMIPQGVRRNRARTTEPVPVPLIHVDGGMYADDVVFFEGSIEHAKQRCRNLVRWGEVWGMGTNFAKSGVLLWSYDAVLREAYEATEFVTPKGTFPKVKSYKYLGIDVSEDLPLFMGTDSAKLSQGRCTDALQHAKSLAAKGLRTLSTLKPLLCDRRCPLPLKLELIRTFVFSVMMYGGEFIGFNKRLAAPVQRVADLAMRWCFGLRKTNTQVASLVLSVELGLPLIYVQFSGLRARLYHKLKLSETPMQTLLPDLQRAHAFTPSRTWCSENELWLKRFHAPPGPSGRTKGWFYGKSGIFKYASLRVAGTATTMDEFYSPAVQGKGRVFDQGRYDHFCGEITEWFANGCVGDSAWGEEDYTFRCWTLIPPKNPFPVRGWYTQARVFELHRRSNRFTSNLLRYFRKMVAGVDLDGRILTDQHFLKGPALRLGSSLEDGAEVDRVMTVWNAFQGDRLFADEAALRSDFDSLEVAFGDGQDSGARRLFMREVQECALERLFSTDGKKTVSFANWYDKFQFGSTRDYVRASLGRPDLAEGVRLLALVRVGGFPRVHNATKKHGWAADRAALCPLCGADVPIGFDWIHLVLDCSDWAVVRARARYLKTPLRYLAKDTAVKEFFEAFPELPCSLADIPYNRLKARRTPAAVRFGIAIRLAGGCLASPLESAYLLSFGQCDFVLTGLGSFGYVFLASFLQEAAPIYFRALGMNNPAALELASTSSLVGSDGLDFPEELREVTVGDLLAAADARHSGDALGPNDPLRLRLDEARMSEAHD